MTSRFKRPEMILSLINGMRMDADISVAQMTYGLCNKTLPGKVLNGENRKLDKLLIDALYQRLGKNLRNFECLLDADEYKLFEAREAFRDAFAKNDTEKARLAAKKYAGMKICEKNALNHQMALLFEIDLLLKERADDKEILEKAYEAIRLTIPEFEPNNIKDYLYTEIELILLDIILKENQKLFGDDFVYPFYKKVYELYQMKRYSENEQVYRFAPMIRRLVLIMLKMRAYDDVTDISERMIRDIVSDNRIKYLAEFLDIKSEAETGKNCPEGASEEEKRKYREGLIDHRYAKAVIEVLKKYHSDWSADEDIQIYWEYMVIPAGKIVKQRRMMLGLSQEDIIQENGEQICSIDTISRFENGKHSMSWEAEKMILKRLKLMPERFHREFMTDCYDDIKVLKNVIDAQAVGDAKKVREWLDKLEEIHKKTLYPTNELYIALLEHRNKGITNENIEDEVKKIMNILSLTMPGNLGENGELKQYYCFNNELLIIMTIIQMWFREGKNEEAFVLCNNLLDAYDSLETNRNTFVSSISIIERMLASELGNRGYYEESDEIAVEGLKKCFSHNLLELWCGYLYCIAWNNGANGKAKKDKQIELRAAYVLASLQKKKRLVQKIISQCDSHYDEDILLDLKNE